MLLIMSEFNISGRNKVKRVPVRGHYDRKTIYDILDAGFVCHMGFNVNGQPFVIPTLYGRKEDKVYLHGATTSRMVQQLERGIPACLTVTHLDGLVLARSAFHHSANYRSAVVFGTATLVKEEEKNEALYVISEQVLKGRWEEVRKPSPKELKATAVLALQIEEASAKIRTGGPKDEPEDYELDIWAGVVPLSSVVATPVDDDLLKEGLAVPPSVKQYLADSR